MAQLETVQVKAIPSALPDFLEYDAEKLVEIGDHVTVADLTAPEGVEFETEIEHSIATVYEPSALAAANDAAGGDAEEEEEPAEGEEGEGLKAKKAPKAKAKQPKARKRPINPKANQKIKARKPNQSLKDPTSLKENREVMGIEPAVFDEASEQFLDHYGQVRGHVRSTVTRHNLTQHLRGASLAILDYQAGDGRDSIWAASESMRDRPLLLEESAKMINHAMETIKTQKVPVRQRIVDVVQGNLESIDEAQQFDVIFSHGVLMYELDDPQGQLNALAARLSNKGILSLLTKGQAAARSQIKPDGLEEFYRTGVYTNRLGRMARAYSFDELTGMVAKAGLRTEAQYGVRIFSDDDRRPLEQVPTDELDDIVAREIEASQDPAVMEQGQMLHIIASKS